MVHAYFSIRHRVPVQRRWGDDLRDDRGHARANSSLEYSKREVRSDKYSAQNMKLTIHSSRKSLTNDTEDVIKITKDIFIKTWTRFKE